MAGLQPLGLRVGLDLGLRPRLSCGGPSALKGRPLHLWQNSYRVMRSQSLFFSQGKRRRRATDAAGSQSLLSFFRRARGSGVGDVEEAEEEEGGE